jgi:hypothetical protein
MAHVVARVEMRSVEIPKQSPFKPAQLLDTLSQFERRLLRRISVLPHFNPHRNDINI